MSLISKWIIVTFILLVYFCDYWSYAVRDTCIIGHPDKCLGNITTEFGQNKDSILIREFSVPNTNQCFSNCTEDRYCKMAIFTTSYDGQMKCSLYRNINFIFNNKVSNQIFIWSCCNTNYSSTNKDKFCPGYWASRDNYIINNRQRKYDYLSTTTSTKFECLSLCYKNPFCGAVNFYEQEVIIENGCLLVMLYPTEAMNAYSYDWGWTSYVWKCADNYELPALSNQVHLRKGFDPGYWVSDSTKELRVNMSINTVLYFYTSDYKQCLVNCEYYEKCRYAWYSKFGFMCILEAEEDCQCAEKLQEIYSATVDVLFNRYKWYSPKSKESFNNYNPLNVIRYGDCHKIYNNTNMLIVNSSCGELPNKKSLVVRCKEEFPGIQFKQSLHCQNEQGFKIIRQAGYQELEFGGSSEYLNLTWVQVTTGYENFWLGNVTIVNFPKQTDEYCATYRVDFKSEQFHFEESNEIPLISREEWGAMKLKNHPPLFPDNVMQYVIFTTTEQPYCGCYSEEACKSAMQILDYKMHYIYNVDGLQYNFIVTSDGKIYETRGWKLKNQATGRYNSIGISIAHLGRHKNRQLTPEAVRAAKFVILQGIKLGKLSENYKILLHNDISRYFDQYYLERVYYLYKSYRGYFINSCIEYSILTISLNFVLFIAVLLLMIGLIHWNVYRIHHNKLCIEIISCRIESIFGTKVDKPIEILPHITIQNADWLSHNFVLISPITSLIYWIESKHTKSIDKCQCKHAVKSLLDLHKFKSSLVNINSILQMTELTSCADKSLYLIFERQPEIGKDHILLLHLPIKSNSQFTTFIGQMYAKSCVCLTFELMKYIPEHKLLYQVCKQSIKIASTEPLNVTRELGSSIDNNKTVKFTRNSLQNRFSFKYDEFNQVQFYYL